jgi:mannose-1-phosphate guanylyltransferase
MIAQLLIFMIMGVSVVSDATMKQSDLYVVILAGGMGERLWPLSRQEKPKQLLAVGQDKTLLEQAIDRARLVTIQDHIWVSTTRMQEDVIREHVGNIVGRILVEPGSRNTGPAILYACFQLCKNNPDALVIFVSADAFIPESDYHMFASAVEKIVNFSRIYDDIVLCGAVPHYPATGYGYIEYGSLAYDQTELYTVVRFHEKPSLAVARYYLQAQSMLWNIGMFGGSVSTFKDIFEQVAPEIFQGMVAYNHASRTYEELPNISIDYAVLERTHRVTVLPINFSWCDVGNIGVLLALQEQYHRLENNIIAIDANNNLVHAPHMLVALVGVDDLCIVQTKDALLITKRDEAEQVRAVVNHLKVNDQHEYL